MAKKPLKFEEALAKLEEIVESIEQGHVGLEDSIKHYEEGMGLIAHCRTILAEAELKIQQLQADGEGKLEAKPFEPDADESETGRE
ncbi:MAG: exodeoxyribonuclease VII small subunit [Phycisphaerae bacterium]|nr:exodeoxyribonuclease VII small subunit [Phycisphaerae bacterium]